MGSERDGRAVANETKDIVSVLSSVNVDEGPLNIPLYKSHPALLPEDKITPERIYNHEDQLVKVRSGLLVPAHFILPSESIISSQSGHKRLIWKESRREY